MAEAFRSEQGTIVPTLFVGLGGMGSRVVNRIAQRAARLPNWESQLRPLTVFVTVDTNRLDLDRLEHVPLGNRLHIGAFDKQTVIRNFRDDGNRQALQWLPANYVPREGVKPGAGQIRLESRLGFFFNSPDIRDRLRTLIRETLAPGITWRRTTPRDYYVYMFSTVAGGTGSGSFLPMAYLVRDVIRSEGEWQPRIIANLLLSTMVVDRVGTHLHPDIHANSYAALKELEHLTKLDYRQVREEGRTQETFVYYYDRTIPDVTVVERAPFFLSIVYDKSNLTTPDVEAVVADTAYLQIFTPNIANMASALDNYEKRISDLTRFAGSLREVGQGYAKNFGVVGASALVLPGEDLLEYCALRFAAEALRGQITFGVDLTESGDDRARALARLSVNYDDPRFLRMGDEGRDRVINQAFMESVREMARQDAREELREGFWFQLVESVDTGRVTGADDKGNEQRAESMLAHVKRRLEEARRAVVNKVAIRERAFTFHKEGLNQYREYVDRLREEIRGARVLVEEGLRGLRMAAAEGEVVVEERLDPVTERYLVLRLLDQCEGTWIPEAQKQYDTARQRDINDPKVADRIEEYYKSLQEASGGSRLPFFRGGDQAFLSLRDEAQEYYRSVGTGARRLFDAEIQLAQFRELAGYLHKRSRQYARLARHVNAMVTELEATAEGIRLGRNVLSPRFALGVEVFETLDEPRRRIWAAVYRMLYVDGGRYLSTFDRKTLAAAIAEELKPVVRPDGAIVEKSDDETAGDLRTALVELGRQRLRPAIFGGEGQPGLDVASGLELEAHLVLGGGKTETAPARRQVEEYVDRKLRALAQISGVQARTSSVEWATRGDGVVLDRTRFVVHGLGAGSGRVPERFLEQMHAMLIAEGRPLNVDVWHDPRLLIVYDVELPIPLYYIRPIVEDLERAYAMVQADEKRGYNLHIDFNWEESLPNLNPYKAEIAVGWSLRTFADALVAAVIERDAAGAWRWHRQDGNTEILPTLVAALYRIGDLHRRIDLKDVHDALEKSVKGILDRLSSEERAARVQAQVEKLQEVVLKIGYRRLEGKATPQDNLDRPVLVTLMDLLDPSAASARTTTTR